MTQITSDAFDHKWPSINNNGDIVWSQQVGGFWQAYLLQRGSSTASPVAGQEANHNNQFHVIEDAGDVMYMKDGVGAAPGLVVVVTGASRAPLSSAVAIHLAVQNPLPAHRLVLRGELPVSISVSVVTAQQSPIMTSAALPAPVRSM
jgi:hypothetical protein